MATPIEKPPAVVAAEAEFYDTLGRLRLFRVLEASARESYRLATLKLAEAWREAESETA